MSNPSRLQPLEIFCDEAGHTGSDLLQPQQRYFSFASVAVGDAEAAQIIAEARGRFPVQMPELKAAKLLKSSAGRALIEHLFASLDGRYIVTVHNKLLALGAQAFQYLVEPVFKDNPRLLYDKNLHRFVAMICYVWFTARDRDAAEAIKQFQNYMRTLDESCAPLLFSVPNQLEATDPFMSLLQFARGYKDRILADNRDISQLPEDGKWVLDLATTCLFSHLNHWGQSRRPLTVRCDDSKPLRAMSHTFKGDDSDAGIRMARASGFGAQFGWHFHQPMRFVNSREHPGIQLADIVAGTTIQVVRDDVAFDCASIARSVGDHNLDCILPDYDFCDPNQLVGFINATILFGLSQRAATRQNPSTNLAAIYHLAERAFAAGSRF